MIQKEDGWLNNNARCWTEMFSRCGELGDIEGIDPKNRNLVNTKGKIAPTHEKNNSGQTIDLFYS